jgi:hypothetical protein
MIGTGPLDTDVKDMSAKQLLSGLQSDLQAALVCRRRFASHAHQSFCSRIAIYFEGTLSGRLARDDHKQGAIPRWLAVLVSGPGGVVAMVGTSKIVARAR